MNRVSTYSKMIVPLAAATRWLPALAGACLLALAGSLQAQEKLAADSGYVLRPNDAIRLDVFGEPELSTSVRILKTGEVAFPLIGTVVIGGLSVSNAVEKIRELFEADYLVDPKVTITVQEYATEFVSVIGAVRTPGQIPIPMSGHLDLATAMATTGGLSETADPGRIQLIRASGAASFYTLKDITYGAAGRTRLSSGDRIIVNQSAFIGKAVTVLGQVGRQGPIGFPSSGKLDLVQAIAAAGGMTRLANPKKVMLNRQGTITTLDYEAISRSGTNPFALQPGDILIVKERLF